MSMTHEDARVMSKMHGGVGGKSGRCQCSRVSKTHFITHFLSGYYTFYTGICIDIWLGQDLRWLSLGVFQFLLSPFLQLYVHLVQMPKADCYLSSATYKIGYDIRTLHPLTQ